MENHYWKLLSKIIIKKVLPEIDIENYYQKSLLETITGFMLPKTYYQFSKYIFLDKNVN
jgi:hypothetical protein